MVKKRFILLLIFFILAAEAVGLAGSLFFGGVDSWYAALLKPSFNPPSWVFGPAWTILYALMGVAAYLVWQRGGKKELQWYWAQLAVNAIWMPLFFGLHNTLLALVDIVVLWILIAITTGKFARVSRTAALLLAPYLVWVSFAAVLNASIWYLN